MISRIALIFVIMIAAVFVAAEQKSLTQYRSEWEMYKFRYNKQYISGSKEDNYRFRLYLSRLPENNEKIRQQQKENPLATFGVTPFSDWTRTELESRRNKKLAASILLKKKNNNNQEPKINHEALSKFMSKSAESRSVNWTARGKVSPIRNQGQCGSCWAFSSVAALYSQQAIKRNRFVPLSPQELVSCDTKDFG